ncbi:hypothetical protein PYCC9005_005566, partial [Savitreella phatthalungensis]
MGQESADSAPLSTPTLPENRTTTNEDAQPSDCDDHKRTHYKARVNVASRPVDVEKLDRFAGWYAQHRDSPLLRIDLTSKTCARLLSNERVRYVTGWPTAYDQFASLTSTIDADKLDTLEARLSWSLDQGEHENPYHNFWQAYLQLLLNSDAFREIRGACHLFVGWDVEIKTLMDSGTFASVKPDLTVTAFSAEKTWVNRVLFLAEVKCRLSFDHQHLGQALAQLIALRERDRRKGLEIPVYHNLAIFQRSVRIICWRPRPTSDPVSRGSRRPQGVVTISPPISLVTRDGHDELLRCLAAIVAVKLERISTLETAMP